MKKWQVQSTYLSFKPIKYTSLSNRDRLDPCSRRRGRDPRLWRILLTRSRSLGPAARTQATGSPGGTHPSIAGPAGGRLARAPQMSPSSCLSHPTARGLEPADALQAPASPEATAGRFGVMAPCLPVLLTCVHFLTKPVFPTTSDGPRSVHGQPVGRQRSLSRPSRCPARPGTCWRLQRNPRSPRAQAPLKTKPLLH